MEVAQSITQQAEALFLKYGFKSISMDDICQKLRISKKTLYQHVANKSELVKDVIEHRISENQREVSEIRETANDPIEELLLMARMIIKLLLEMSPTTLYDLQKYYHDLWQFIDSMRRDILYGVITENLTRGKSQKIYRSDIDIDLIASLYLQMSTFMFDQKAIDATRERKVKLYYEFVKYHIRGIATKKGHDLLNQYEYFWHE